MIFVGVNPSSFTMTGCSSSYEEKNEAKLAGGLALGAVAIVSGVFLIQAQAPATNPNITDMKEDPPRQITYIHFDAGAPTKWHVHAKGQIVFVEERVALEQQKGRTVRETHIVEAIWCSPGVPHWHGAAPDKQHEAGPAVNASPPVTMGNDRGSEADAPPPFSGGARLWTQKALHGHSSSAGAIARQNFPAFRAALAHFHQTLAYVARHIEAGTDLREITCEILLQGPFSDAMTHGGQIALVRRLAGYAVPPENFVYADISVRNMGPDQPPPARPDEVWPEQD